MGLPLFKTPADDGISSRSDDKNKEATPPHDRTSIRRQRSIRRSDLRSRAEQIQARIRQAQVQVEGFPSTVEPNSASQAADRDDSAIASARSDAERRRRARMNGAPVAHPSPWAGRSTPPLPRLSRDDSAPRVRSSNPWDWSTQPDGPVMPAVPESSDFPLRETVSQQHVERRAILQRLYEERVMSRSLARNPVGRDAQVQESSARLSWADPPFGFQVRNTGLGTGPLEPLDDVLARRRRARLGLPRLDGLGDRDRSLSPDGDGAWNTLLTTISPDPQPPSVGSSFASTTASAAASASSSNARSSNTSFATTMDAPDGTSFETVCEYVETHSPTSESDEEEGDMYELDDARLAGERFWRGYADVVARRADRVARHSGYNDGDALGGMQRIVSRLARREDIPDEWWAEAGLSRTLPRELVR